MQIISHPSLVMYSWLLMSFLRHLYCHKPILQKGVVSFDKYYFYCLCQSSLEWQRLYTVTQSGLDLSCINISILNPPCANSCLCESCCKSWFWCCCIVLGGGGGKLSSHNPSATKCLFSSSAQTSLGTAKSLVKLESNPLLKLYLKPLTLFSFRFVPYIGIVTILMNDYPKFKVKPSVHVTT